MEQELTNEEITRVFAMYWDCKCIKEKHVAICTAGEAITDVMISKLTNIRPNKVDLYKLLLTPLDKISDEHAIEVANFVFTDANTIDERRKIGKNFIGYTYLDKALSNHEAEKCNEFSDTEIRFIFQYLLQKGYAVPLFFGVDHWANGKTAIDLGIAIDKTQN